MSAANALNFDSRRVRAKDITLDLVLYWRSIAKRKWLILGLAVLIGAVTLLIVNMMTPIYRSTATLLVEQSRSKVAPTEEVYASVGDGREHFQTQVEILKSRALAVRVVDKLGLITHPDFDPRQREVSWMGRLRQLVGLASAERNWTDDELQKAAIGALVSRMTVEPVRLSQLIKVSFESSDPTTAAGVANAIAESYIESDVEARVQMNERASEWLGERLAGLKSNLEDSERTLQEYRERKQMIATKGLEQSGATRQIEDVMARTLAARQRRFAAEHAYNQITGAKGDLDVLPIVMRNPFVQSLKEVEGAAEKRVLELANRYGPDHPRMVQAQAELQQSRNNTRREVETVVASLKRDYELAQANENALERALGAAKANVQSLNRKEFDLASLERAVGTNRQIYELFLNRFRETRASREMQATSVARITDEAMASQYPVKPKKEQAVSIAFVLGLMLGALIALLVERLDNTVKSADDAEEKLGQPMLTTLPLLRGEQAKAAGRHYLDDPKSIFSEGIRTARTGVLLSTADSQDVTVLVTSSVPDEGKTAVAINFALAQAQTRRVLLIDADLRRPTVGQQLGLDPNKPGLTSLLSGAATFAECLHRVDNTSLYVITPGTIPLNPLELLMSQRFQRLIKALAATCDMLVIDSPPVHLVSDALVLSTMATGVAFVVKADSTPYPLVRRCIRSLNEVDATVFGIMLNQLDFKKAAQYYGAYTGAYYKYDGYYTQTSKGGNQPVAALRS